MHTIANAIQSSPTPSKQDFLLDIMQRNILAILAICYQNWAFMLCCRMLKTDDDEWNFRSNKRILVFCTWCSAAFMQYYIIATKNQHIRRVASCSKHKDPFVEDAEEPTTNNDDWLQGMFGHDAMQHSHDTSYLPAKVSVYVALRRVQTSHILKIERFNRSAKGKNLSRKRQ